MVVWILLCVQAAAHPCLNASTFCNDVDEHNLGHCQSTHHSAHRKLNNSVRFAREERPKVGANNYMPRGIGFFVQLLLDHFSCILPVRGFAFVTR